MNNVQTRSLLHTHTRDRSNGGLYTHTHSHTQLMCVRTSRCARHTNRRKKKKKWRKTISTSVSPLSSIQRRKKTTTRNGSSSSREWIEIDVILDVDGIEDEIIKAFHLSLQSKRRENHSESIINLKRQLLFSSEEPLSLSCLSFINKRKYSRWSWIVIRRRSLIVGGGWSGRGTASWSSSGR